MDDLPLLQPSRWGGWRSSIGVVGTYAQFRRVAELKASKGVSLATWVLFVSWAASGSPTAVVGAFVGGHTGQPAHPADAARDPRSPEAVGALAVPARALGYFVGVLRGADSALGLGRRRLRHGRRDDDQPGAPAHRADPRARRELACRRRRGTSAPSAARCGSSTTPAPTCGPP